MAEEFWNIPGGLVKVFYGLALVTVLIFILGFWDKIRIWSQGKDADQELKGVGTIKLLLLSIAKFFSGECLFARRVFRRSVIRALMLIGIIWGFTLLFLGTATRTANYYLPIEFLKGGVWLSFSLVLDIAGALVLIGVAFGLYRKYIGKPERRVESKQDGILLILLFLVILTGFCVEGVRLAVLNPPAGDWSPVGLVFGAVIKGFFGQKLLPGLHLSAWVIHFLLAFSFIAYIPFSKYEHMFASQISTYLFEIKEREKEIPRDWVFAEEIAQSKRERQKGGT
jgi:nitrate reductase gamma subunit